MELNYLAQNDERYAKLLVISSLNLGGDGSKDDISKQSLRNHYQNLINNAQAEPGVTSEEGVVDEVNFCRELVEV